MMLLWFSRLRLRLRSLLRRHTLETALHQEMEFHLAEQKAEFVALGMTEPEAELAARRAFGNTGIAAEECRDQRRTRWLEDCWQDLRFAGRSFAHAWSFTAIVVLTLALGIGVNTAFFSASYAILFQPLPYPAPERLLDMDEGVESVGIVTTLRDLTRTVDYAGYKPGYEFNLVQGGADAARVRAAETTFNLSRVLGVMPARGRWFTAVEERPGQHRVAVLSDRLWRERFGMDPAIVGRFITLSEHPYEVVGIMPAGFAFPSPDTELWVPVHLDPQEVGYLWGDANLSPIGRLREGMTIAAAQRELLPTIERIRQMLPWKTPDDFGLGARLLPYQESLVKSVKPKLFALSAASLLLLLIACSNTANLLLSQAVRREREFALRETLGARRGRLLRQLVTENLLLVLMGGALGLAGAAVILKLLPLLLPEDTPRLSEISLNATLASTAAGSLLLTIVLFSAVPLWRFSLQAAGGGRLSTASRRHSRTSLVLIGSELALATALLIGSTLMSGTLWRLSNVNSGIRASANVLSARISAGPSRCPTPARCEAFFDDLSSTLIRVPGARSVSWSDVTPLSKDLAWQTVSVEDHPVPPGGAEFVLWRVKVTPGYFPALGIPLREGRPFNSGDRRGSQPVVIISESTARHFWPGQSAVGKHIRPVAQKEWRTIVGVVSDVAQYSLTGFPSWVGGVQYVPLSQGLPIGSEGVQLSLFLPSDRPSVAAAGITQAIRERYPDLVATRVATLERVRQDSITGQRSTAWLLALLAGLGFLLGVLGVHGVIAHRTAQRTREIGIRIALGADARTVVSMVLRETLVVALAGCGVGIAAAFALSRYLESLLFEVSTHDPAIFTACPAFLLAAALLAAALPARRASHTDPAVTLRLE